MQYLLDTGSLEDIRHCSEYYPLAGVTTNPTIVAREKTDFWELMKEIRRVIGPGKMLHIQTVQTRAGKMIEEAELLNNRIGGLLYVKIPVCEEGLKAAMELKRKGLGVTMTAIFTPTQALVAARAGVDYVAPYVNRLDAIAGDGSRVVQEIVQILRIHKSDCQVLAASFKNVEQIHKCALAGCQNVTVTADLLKAAIAHPMTEAAVAGFERDWKGVYGTRTISEL